MAFLCTLLVCPENFHQCSMGNTTAAAGFILRATLSPCTQDSGAWSSTLRDRALGGRTWSSSGSRCSAAPSSRSGPASPDRSLRFAGRTLRRSFGTLLGRPRGRTRRGPVFSEAAKVPWRSQKDPPWLDLRDDDGCASC